MNDDNIRTPSEHARGSVRRPARTRTRAPAVDNSSSQQDLRPRVSRTAGCASWVQRLHIAALGPSAPHRGSICTRQLKGCSGMSTWTIMWAARHRKKQLLCQAVSLLHAHAPWPEAARRAGVLASLGCWAGNAVSPPAGATAGATVGAAEAPCVAVVTRLMACLKKLNRTKKRSTAGARFWLERSCVSTSAASIAAKGCGVIALPLGNEQTFCSESVGPLVGALR